MPSAPFTGLVSGRPVGDSEVDAYCGKAGLLRTFGGGGRELSVDADVLKENRRWQHEGFLLMGRAQQNSIRGEVYRPGGLSSQLSSATYQMQDFGLMTQSSKPQLPHPCSNHRKIILHGDMGIN